MAEHNTDIIIFGAGIAGLWVCNGLKARGYNVLVLEKNAIGSGQTIASQGIIHSGLKYALGGKITPLAKEISAMPGRWTEILKDSCIAAPSQQLLIPKGFAGGITRVVTKKIFAAKELAHMPDEINRSGFEGSVLSLNEPVLNIPDVLKKLAHKSVIRKIDMNECKIRKLHVETRGHTIHAKAFIFTAGDGNKDCALGMRHKIESQRRPLLMGLMKNVPFPLFAHFIGKSDKPVATITTHKTKDGVLVWYVGGLVAEQHKDSDPQDVYEAIRAAFAVYLPDIDFSGTEWAVLPIDRAEGKSGAKKMPKTPTIQRHNHTLYAWPTKLAFAPLLADMIVENVKDITPSNTQTDWSFLPDVEFAQTPWDKAVWKK
jgi:hypothetical protein